MAKNNGNRMQNGFLQATNYLNSHLNPGETPLYRAHLSWIPVFIHQIPFMLAGGLIGGLVWGITNDFFMGLLIFILAEVIGVLSQLPQCYRNIATDILITDQGIHSKKKLVAVEDDQFARFQFINDAELTYNSILQRILQYGQVEVSLISGSEDDYIFKNLAKPMTFKNALRAAQQRFINGGGAVGMNGGYGQGMRGGMPPNQNMNVGYTDEVGVPDAMPTRNPSRSNGQGRPRNGNVPMSMNRPRN